MTELLTRPTTTVRAQDPSASPADPSVYTRRKIKGVRRTDWLALVGAAASALSLTGLIFHVLTPVSSVLGFAAVSYVGFLVIFALLVSFDERGPVVADRLATVVTWSLGLLLFTVLAFVITYTLTKGADALGHGNFYIEDMTQAGPLQGLEVGGIIHAVAGTLEQITIALVITVPLGLVCALYLNEFPSRFARFVRTIVEAMTALPSIVAGLFIYATFILILGQGKSGLAASLALSVMMLPIIIRAADVVIRLVPANLREASYALGTSRWSTVRYVVLPTARSGLTTAVILGCARGIGETSPVLLTAGFSATMNKNPMEGPQVSLPLAVFEFVRSPQPAMIQRGFGAAAVLLGLVLLLFIVARIVGGRGPGRDTARQRRRRASASARDVRRYAARASIGGLVIALATLTVAQPVDPAHAADDYVPISGAGSTWSQNALDQWRRNVTQYGMQVNYQGTGSSDGRNQFRNGTVDFAVTEIPYGLKDGGVYDAPPDRKYAYMPIVAGGTAFMYNLKIGGKRVTNLRLSGEVVAKIFTGRITTWDDPAIKADNPLLALPKRQIVPVVRSDGSGTTAQFSTWLSKQYTSIWNSYCSSAGRPSPCGVTSFYPVKSGSDFVAQAGSLGVAGFVSQAQNEGTITYLEYSYALNTDFPVVKLLNRSGYYVEPTAENVAVGLLKAQINDDTSSSQYLTQILDGVYANADRRAYPLSSYSYMVMPTESTGSFNTSKGATLGDFAYYFLCEGQQQAPVLGYSPLPINLVKAGLRQVKRIPGVDVQNIDISKCNNPTFSKTGKNTLAANAPYPAACDKVGKIQCTTGTGGDKSETPVSDGDVPAGTNTNGATGGPTGTNGGPAAAPGSGAPVIDPDTGAVVGGTTSTDSIVTASAVDLSPDHTTRMQWLLMLLAGLVLLLVVLVPPVIGQYLNSRGGRR